MKFKELLQLTSHWKFYEKIYVRGCQLLFTPTLSGGDALTVVQKYQRIFETEQVKYRCKSAMTLNNNSKLTHSKTP